MMYHGKQLLPPAQLGHTPRASAVHREGWGGGREREREREEGEGRAAGPTQQRNAVRAFREGYKLQKGTSKHRGNEGRKTDYK